MRNDEALQVRTARDGAKEQILSKSLPWDRPQSFTKSAASAAQDECARSRCLLLLLLNATIDATNRKFQFVHLWFTAILRCILKPEQLCTPSSFIRTHTRQSSTAAADAELEYTVRRLLMRH